MQKISSALSLPLHSVAATRLIEREAVSALPPHTLMRRAGFCVARLAMALAPHGGCIWIACGPGNNGGDGFEAAAHLHRWGRTVVVTWTGSDVASGELPPDARASRQHAMDVGVSIATEPPAQFDVCIDALLGIGAALDERRPGGGTMLRWLALMRQSSALRLAVDVPSGLNADTGASSPQFTTELIAASARQSSAKAVFTLSLLTLKAGLFTADGRDAAGEVWFDDLGIEPAAAEPCAWLLGADRAGQAWRTHAAHASHKGSFGDVAVVGGESAAASHMTGAALLAASAALHAGAGRVFVALLGDSPGPSVDSQQPELMFRSFAALDLRRQVVVCGCGGGEAVKAVLPKLLSSATRVVLDADALNAIADDTQLQKQLAARSGRGYSTVLTPHPLEAARLGGIAVAEVQADRLNAARQLAERFDCVVVLKGSGTVIAAPGQATTVNPTGNALLSTAGTGDVLAGMLGALLASGMDAQAAACRAVFEHGRRADVWAANRPGQLLTASALARWSGG